MFIGPNSDVWFASDSCIATLFGERDEMKPRELEVAIFLAQSMVLELTTALRAWESQVRQFDAMKRRRPPIAN